MILSDPLYPITGMYRDLILYQEWIICFLCIEISIMFLLKGQKYKGNSRNLQEIAFSYLLSGYGGLYICVIIADFYTNTVILHGFFSFMGYLINMVTLCFFYYKMERFQKFGIRYLYSVIQLFHVIFYIIFYILNVYLIITVISLSYIAVLFIFLVNFMISVGKKKETSRTIQLYRTFVLLAIIAFISFTFGLCLTLDLIAESLGLFFRFFGNFFQMVGIVAFYFTFSILGSFAQFGWRKSLNKIYIMMKSGLGIYGKDFEKNELLDFIMVSGNLRSIQYVLDTITDKSSISLIERDENILIIFPYKELYAVLIVDTYFSILENLLTRLMERIYYFYENIIEQWDHSLKNFEALDELVMEMFQ